MVRRAITLVPALILYACGHGSLSDPTPIGAPCEAAAVSAVLVSVSLSDYQGAYSMASTLDVSATTLLGQLRGFYTTLDDGETYDLTAPAEVERLEIVPDPDLDLAGWPGYRIRLEATVDDVGIRVTAEASSWFDEASSDYFDRAIYAAAGLMEISALGEVIRMQSGVHYDEPGELVGDAGITVRVEPTSGE